MQLNKFTDISMRVLMYLSRTSADKQVTISEIATVFNVPRNHLIKIITRLNKLGWIIATRGRNGGLVLNPQSLSLRVGDMLQELEATTNLIDCEKPVCGFHGGCILKGALQEGMNVFFSHMNQFQLADIVDNISTEKIVFMRTSGLKRVANA